MEIEITNLSPADDGQSTDITISMSRSDAIQFFEMYRRGEFKELGITSAALVEPASALPDHRERVSKDKKPDMKSYQRKR
jgi:hypothetical protein